MAVGNRKNKSYFTYVDDNAVTWNVLGEDGGAGTAVDGHAAFIQRHFGRSGLSSTPRLPSRRSPGVTLSP
jgi:hypothetical protein